MKKKLLEKELVLFFESVILPNMNKKGNTYRVYAYEFPVSNEKGKIDMILENHIYGDSLKNPLILIEFKKSHIKYGALDQIKFYKQSLGKKLHRPTIECWLVAPSFSDYEQKEAFNNNVKCLQICAKTAHYRFL